MSETLDAPKFGALTVITAALPTVLAADKDDLLGKLREELDGFEPDVTTPKGRKAIASKAYAVSRTKAELVRLAGTLKEDAQARIKSINGEVRTIEERLDALKAQIRKPLDDFEAAEEARVKAHEDALAAIETLARVGLFATPEGIRMQLDAFETAPPLTRDWQEFVGRADKTITASRNALKVALADAERTEAEAREEQKRQAEEAERRRQEEERQRQEREAEIARQAAERARLEAEQKAREEQEARERAHRAEQERLQREKEEAERRAQAEREAAAQRERDAREAAERAEREKAEAERRAQEAAERADRERIGAERRAEEQRLAAERKAEEQRIAAERQREADRIEAQQREERARQEAIEAERRRIAEEEEAKRIEDERRAANRAHRGRINREAAAAIITVIGDAHSGNAEEAAAIAQAVVVAIAKSAVPHISIQY